MRLESGARSIPIPRTLYTREDVYTRTGLLVMGMYHWNRMDAVATQVNQRGRQVKKVLLWWVCCRRVSLESNLAFILTRKDRYKATALCVSLSEETSISRPSLQSISRACRH